MKTQALAVHRGGLEDFGEWMIDNDESKGDNCPSNFILSKVLLLLEF